MRPPIFTQQATTEKFMDTIHSLYSHIFLECEKICEGSKTAGAKLSELRGIVETTYRPKYRIGNRNTDLKFVVYDALLVVIDLFSLDYGRLRGDLILTKLQSDKEVFGSPPEVNNILKLSGTTDSDSFVSNSANPSASELISRNIREHTQIGNELVDIMTDGKDLEDKIVIKLISEKLQSPECHLKGFILDDFPTNSEQVLSIAEQLNMLSELRPEINCYVYIHGNIRKKYRISAITSDSEKLISSVSNSAVMGP
ncbi:adenylate kinase [Clonorchis sinensis]|uniref:Adenylate kinase n=1 Tax=Clonorchis sinensis TaxID=79923 RepID=G7YAM8_CLOSI|nr:adenylate kinase [Clonorchis sinensis]